MSEVLTEKQEAVLKYIEDYQMEHGSSPTLREMREFFGVSSDNSILKHLKALEEKGCITKDDTPRGIKLLSIVKERLQSNEFKLPLLGMVPAGGPILTEEYIENWLNIGEDAVYRYKDSYLLRVKGESMVDAGIFDGDILVVCGSLEAREGDIVVALIDNENTVKRYMKDSNGRVYLKPENPNYENIYPEGNLCTQGVVTGLLRYYKR
ncbi:transcriptional repressor LexA [Patescibacteria group bacterium]|nr:transcriptional repressor LexA [Patescibacteria group bacterium]MBU1703572.1 transcriptional repressor LexA [Patescibacteria group bacterium]MBU1954077.1 transcriptional repressor LexA [Patescibacteria group bacterium]